MLAKITKQDVKYPCQGHYKMTRAGFKPRPYRSQSRRSNHSATLSTSHNNSLLNVKKLEKTEISVNCFLRDLYHPITCLDNVNSEK